MLTSQRFCLILLIAPYAALAAGAPPPTLTPGEKLAGWTLLFDGRTMNGWDDPRAKTPPGDAWTIEDGCLKANAHPRIVEDLFTKMSFTGFELAFDWRISPHGNSGVKYRIQDHLFVLPPGAGESFEQSVERSFLNRVSGRPARGQDYVIGFEYQVLDSPSQIDPRQSLELSMIWSPPQARQHGQWASSIIRRSFCAGITWSTG
jgi:hypothetical protein